MPKQSEKSPELKELEAIKRLLAQSLLKDYRGDSQVAFLKKAGFVPNEIANLLNKSRNSIDQALYRLKVSQKRK